MKVKEGEKKGLSLRKKCFVSSQVYNKASFYNFSIYVRV